MSIKSMILSNHLILCRPCLLLPSIFPSIRVFSSESVLHIRWPKYWSFSFSISPSNEYSGLISFRIDRLDLIAVQGTLEESSPIPQFESISSSALSFLYSSTLTSIHDYWKNHIFGYMDLCRQKGLFLSTLFYSFQMPRHNISKRGHESVRSRLREKVWCQKYSLGLNSRSTTFYLADLSISFPIFTFFFSLSSKRGQ